MQLNALDLNLLVALDALLAEQSITRAAQRLNLSPSATSGALGRLRDYFGDELLARVGRRMVPTPLGEILRGEVRDCLLHIQAAVQARPSFDPAQARRHFRLMMSDYAATVVMPGVLQRLEREAPGLTLELLSTSTQPSDALDRGDIDFLVLPRQFIRDPHPCVVLFADDYVCVVSADHPTVGSELTVAQFLALGHVVTRVGTYRPPTVDETYFERFGQVRRIEVIASTFTSVPHLLVGTWRVATLHRRLAEIYVRTLPLRIVPLPVPMPPVEEVLQWHQYRQQDPGQRWLQALLREVADPARIREPAP